MSTVFSFVQPVFSGDVGSFNKRLVFDPLGSPESSDYATEIEKTRGR